MSGGRPTVLCDRRVFQPWGPHLADNSNAMPKDRSALRAGILMLASIGLIVFVVISIKGLGWIKDPSDIHIAAFDLKTNVGGLRVGDEVRIGGFKVGDIRRITLRTRDEDPSRPPHIVVAFSVPRRYGVREDARLRVDGTLTGTSWLNFEDLGQGARLAPGTPLIGAPSTTSELLAKVVGLAPEVQGILADVHAKTIPALNSVLEDVKSTTVPRVNTTIDKIGATADSIRTTSDTTTALASDLRGAVKPILERYHAAADKAIAMMEAIRGMFGESSADFHTTVANLRKATDSVAARLPGMLAKIDTGLDGVNKSLAELHQTVLNAKELTATAKTVVVGNKGKIDGMIDSVKKAGDNLKAATAEVRHSPWRLLYKPGPGEVANLNIYDSARQFAEGANDLNNSVTALRDALKEGSTSEAELQALMQRVEKSFTNFKQVESKLIADVKE